MPIYAYRCEACGFAKDVLQKISDDALTVCPSCHQDSFRKQLTAAGFQLKGSGWYVTDFRGNGSGTANSKGANGTGIAGTAEAPAAAAATETPAAPAAAAPAPAAPAAAAPSTPSAS
ncbi:FmdB family transcriptional regulator [Herbaspirillum rubrisubalbicans M1]|uniref:FmdB family zinc ribbon protein n=1 Tax=Herbaspirillum rubrisubalbicans TaxID=80842 RepID=UPI00073A377D|nr:FmdB family zinc ribbon protein [Herbaspirillum rubrisubalbicans]ALU87445.1 FmdB family transcriptional regulator [Herbaspirillum rubrisubalbicans M1]